MTHVPHDQLTPGHWYLRVAYEPGYDIVYLIRNQLSEEGEMMVFSTDREGCTYPEDYAEDQFIGPVPAP